LCAIGVVGVGVVIVDAELWWEDEKYSESLEKCEARQQEIAKPCKKCVEDAWKGKFSDCV
jgi:hypothetical protein